MRAQGEFLRFHLPVLLRSICDRVSLRRRLKEAATSSKGAGLNRVAPSRDAAKHLPAASRRPEPRPLTHDPPARFSATVPARREMRPNLDLPITGTSI